MHDSYQILIKHVPWIKKLNNIYEMCKCNEIQKSSV